MTDRRFDDPLIVEPLGNGNWQLHGAFDYHTDVALSGYFAGPYVVCVPDKFITDFASIPRPFWNIFPPYGEYGKAAVIHDYLYRTHGIATKAQADSVFKEAMQALGVGWWTRNTLYWAVRVGGARSYKGGL